MNFRWRNWTAAPSAVFVAALAAAVLGRSLATAGPDVIVGDLPSMANYGTSGGIDAFAVGTSSCNLGDEPLAWVAGTNQHPVIGQNMYRLKDGRFEQIGMSWLKHGFFALQDPFLCTDPECVPNPNGSALGVGCSDPYGAGLNGSQSGLGPRYEVNASDGSFPYPFDDPPIAPVIGRRLQVHVEDLDPDLNEDALYFIEGHYIHPEDAEEDNDDNNASWREITISTITPGENFSAATIGLTKREEPAIYAWEDEEPSVTLVNIDVADDGRFVAGYLVTDNGDGTWHYEYAIHNLNSDRSAGSFSVPVAAGADVLNVGFHDVDYHSGEPFDGTDWSAEVTATAVTWTVAESFTENADANALRWGTLYNFRFDSNAPPEAGDLTLGLFKPGAEAEVTFGGEHPGGSFIAPVHALACAHTPDGIQVSWLNEEPYELIEVYRDGSIIEFFFDQEFAYLDPISTAGTYTYEVIPYLQSSPALGRVCEATVPPAPPPGFDFEVSSPSALFDVVTGAGTFGATITLREDADHAGYPSAIEAFGVGLRHDPLLVTATAVEMSADLEAANGGDGPDFFAAVVWADGITIGSLVDFELSGTLSAAAGIAVAEVAYEVAGATMAGRDQGAITVLSFASDVGTAAAPNSVIVAFAESVPEPLAGIVTLNPDDGSTQPFVRGDVNGDGQQAIEDAIQMLAYLFTNGAVDCVDATDVDDDGALIINDAVWLLSYLFLNGAPPPAPATTCGLDTTADLGADLGCLGPVPACP